MAGLVTTHPNAGVSKGGPCEISALRLIFELGYCSKYMARRKCTRCKQPRVQKPGARICSYCRNNTSPPKNNNSTTTGRRKCTRCKQPRVQKPGARICSYCRNNTSPPKNNNSTTKGNNKRAKSGDKNHSGWVTHVKAKGERDKNGDLLNSKIWKTQYIDRYGEGEFKCACIVGEPYFADGKKMKPLVKCSGIEVGAHVTLRKSYGIGDHYIVPMCKKHNDGWGGQIQGGKGILYSVKVSKCISMRARKN